MKGIETPWLSLQSGRESGALGRVGVVECEVGPDRRWLQGEGGRPVALPHCRV